MNDLSSVQYSISKNIRFKTSMLRSDLCDYSDTYIVVKSTVNHLAAAANEDYKAGKDIAFKSNAPFRSCFAIINSTVIDNAEDLIIVMSMLEYNLLEYSQNFSMTSQSLWNSYRDEIDDIDDNALDGK